MLQQMWESMLHQLLHVYEASNTQKIQSFDLPKINDVVHYDIL